MMLRNCRILQPLAAPTLQPVTLGALAVGSSGLTIWRREKSLVPEQ
jgi:hypothetical protein